MPVAYYDVNEATMTLFKAVVVKKVSDASHQLSNLYLEILTDALKRGVLINPEIIKESEYQTVSEITQEAVDMYGVDVTKLNSTFYKRFSDVENNSELQLRLDQLAHYASTYGRGYKGTDRSVYEPEYLKNIDFDVKSELVFIDAITKDELADKVKNMLISGIALSEQAQDLLETIIDEFNLELDYVDQISNREFMCRLCKKYGMLPKNFDEFTRYLIYLATGSTLLIKSRDMLNQLGHLNGYYWDNNDKYDLLEQTFDKYVDQFGIEQVAQNITRYRELYLILRKHFDDKTLINRATKLSKRMYKPRKQSSLEHVMDHSVSLDQIEKVLYKASIYKLVKLWNAMRNYGTTDARYFKIRNGKSYLKVPGTDKNVVAAITRHVNRIGTATRASTISVMVVNEITERLGDWSNKVFFIPEGVNYALPTSGKDFVGSMPYMTTYDFEGQDLSVGVAWDTPNTDLDLHMMSLDGQHYGWNSRYRGVVTYSGDMTNLNRYGYAAEFYKLPVGRIKEPMIVNLSDYRSNGEVKFDVFVTGANVNNDSSQGVATQIDDKSVLFHSTISPQEASKVLMLVFPTDKGMRIAFTSVNYGNMYVPKVDNSTGILIDLLNKQVDNAVTLNELIELLGGHITSDIDELKEYMRDNAKVSTSEIVTTTSGVYAKVTSQVPEIINLTPSNVTQSTFIDLLKEPEEA